MRLHVFNPEHDMALASNNKLFIAPHAARQMRKDLGFIPALWADDGDMVLVDDIDAALDAQRHVSRFTHDVMFVTLDNIMTSLSSLSNIILEPWGWDSSIVNELCKACPSMYENIPSESMLSEIRNISNRRFASECLLPQLSSYHSQLIGESRYIKTIEEAEAFVSSHGNAVVKSPWSCSGRGVRYIEEEMSKSTYGWCVNIIEKQGGILMEPYYNKVRDFGMEFYVDLNGCIHYKGLSLFTTINGAYTGNLVTSEKDKMEILSRYVSQALLETLRDEITSLLSPLLKGKYVGPLGIDMMIVPNKDNKGFSVHPCVEMNLRRTMGHVALALTPKGIEPRHQMSILFTDRYKCRINKMNDDILNTTSI